jgi:hypothetical protein
MGEVTNVSATSPQAEKSLFPVDISGALTIPISAWTAQSLKLVLDRTRPCFTRS